MWSRGHPDPDTRSTSAPLTIAHRYEPIPSVSSGGCGGGGYMLIGGGIPGDLWRSWNVPQEVGPGSSPGQLLKYWCKTASSLM